MVKKYVKIWWMFTCLTTQIALISRFGAIMFFIGKILRLLFFLGFLLILVTKTKSLGGYSLWEVVFFFLTFNFIDTLAQFLLREVYRFRSYIISGSFDYILLKPISPLLRSLFGGSDALDMVILIISIPFLIWVGEKIGEVSFAGVSLYILLVLNAFLIALGFHILVLALGVVSTEVDNAIMFYRDITQMGRIPIDVYKEPVRSFLTFALPVGIMMSFPAKAFLGLLSWQNVFASVVIGFGFLGISLFAWKKSLRHYSSASS